MELAKHYDPADTEARWYKHWLDRDYFRSVPDEREAFTIVIPPPNVTGVLHMGHLLNNTVQDILIRHARKSGKNACWVPGTDHASIATEAKVVKRLRERGIKKSDLSREEFLAEAFTWKEEYGGIILNQLQRLGASCDWSRTRFTMEPSLSDAVTKVFVDLYRKGRLYRGLRMTNWDPEAQTVLSNEEVIHAPERRPLYYVRYKVEGTDEYLTVATVRPETIMGDSAVAVHPEDSRYQHLIGRRVHVPLTSRTVPVIADDYVDPEFGTGALKITPAHDVNDHEVGKRHGLEVIDVLNADGTMAESAGIFVGIDREKARKLAAKQLEADGALLKVEDYDTSVGRSERTGAVVEPRLTLQWFVKMDEFAAEAMAGVEREGNPAGETEFHPPHFFNMFRQWVGPDKVRDWCISRQLWWGHRIPAWYVGEGEEARVFVALTMEEALVLAKAELGESVTAKDLKQDEDVLDTWFSSWLWPISVFDGFDPAHRAELAYYYPTDVLVTGWDIIYLWVARMMMAGSEYAPELLGAAGLPHESPESAAGPPPEASNGAPGSAPQTPTMPFKHVYWTGMVRDAQKRKMSKSLGNSPDALALLDKYGADGVRFGMLSAASAGGDIIFDAPLDPKTKQALDESKLCEQGRSFCNKMWNALKLIQGWETTDSAPGAVETLAIEWVDAKFQLTLRQVESDYASFRLNDALGRLYSFIWDDFCSWFLEMIKPGYQEPISVDVKNAAVAIFGELMNVLHPFMPFVTEEIWHRLGEQTVDLCVAPLPKAGGFDESLIARVEAVKDIVARVREQRSLKGLSPKLELPLATTNPDHAVVKDAGLGAMLQKMANVSAVAFPSTSTGQAAMNAADSAVSFVVGTEKFYLTLPDTVDLGAERERLEKELAHQRGFVAGIEKKLSNERFVAGAPEAVIASERKKLSDGLARVKAIEESLGGE